MADPVQSLNDGATLGRTLIHGGALRLLGYGGATLLSVLTAAITLRYLGPADAGLYYEVLSIVAIAGATSEAGLGAVGLREYSVLTEDQRGGFVVDLLALRTTLLSLSLIVTVIAVAPEGATVLWGTVVAGCAAVVLVAQGTLQIPLIARERMAAVAGIQLLIGVLGAGAVLLVISANGGVVLLVGVFLPGGIISSSVIALLIRSEVGLRPAVRVRNWWRILRPNLLYSVGAFLGVVWFRVGPILVARLASRQQAGFYGVAFRVSDAFETIAPLLLTVMLPRLSRAAHLSQDDGALDDVVSVLLRVMAFAGAAVALGVAVAAPTMVSMLGGPAFRQATGTLQILAVSLLPAFLLQTWGYTLLALRAHRHIVATMVLGSLCVGVLSFALVPRFGAEGEATALLISHLAVAAGYLVSVIRLRAKVNHQFTAIVGCALCAGLSWVAVRHVRLDDPARLAICLTIYLATTLALRIAPLHLLRRA